jgi:hypothetical protein
MEWAGPDSDRRPSARQADVLTRLDDRPTFALCYKFSVSAVFMGFALNAFNSLRNQLSMSNRTVLVHVISKVNARERKMI